MADARNSVASRLRASKITKTYGGVEVLHGVDLTVGVGERHAIVGENGAGKSTLMKIISGVERRDSGAVEVDGVIVEEDAHAARAAGIALVHQELSLVPTLSIAENCVLGRHPTRLGLVRRNSVRAVGREAIRLVGLHRSPDTPVERLSFAERQLVEIGRALLAEPKVIVLDEPTSALSPRETERLFGLLEEVNRERQTSIIYVSHRVAEVFRLCEGCTVLRDGSVVGKFRLADTSPDALVHAMVGRQVDLLTRREGVANDQLGGVAIETKDISGPGVRRVSLAVRAGEVCGIAGLVGSGRTEFARLLTGLARPSGGVIEVEGTQVTIGSPRRARSLGIAYVPEDRQKEGLALEMSAGDNATVPSLRQLSPSGLLRPRLRTALAQRVLTEVDVRPPVPTLLARRLSGGNQQKIVLGKWLPTQPRILVLDEPTRGVDVGAKSDIHNIVDTLARAKTAVIVISSDLPELLVLADRIVVMRDGTLVGEVGEDAWDERSVIELAAGTGQGPQTSAV